QRHAAIAIERRSRPSHTSSPANSTSNYPLETAKSRKITEQNDITLHLASDELLLGVRETVATTRPTSVSETALIDDQAMFVIPPALSRKLATRGYWPVKRMLDIVLALVLMIVLFPLYVLLAIVCALDVGFPILFWQQRPGLGARSLRVYKFRTMGTSHTSAGHLRSDKERTSWIGRLIRSRRLDELPQLLAILTGKMSFVGPRPLLPVDQSQAVRCRLLIRPGLTGWAQVSGGRTVSPLDKAALDLWYIQNASLRLDVKILMKTGLLLLTGDQYQAGMIAVAWEDLRRSGIVRLSRENEEAHC
ncbi:MAG: lipopolysaccharide/colanic/teichoic acid biosynthesis glycosyltransferase, partial [Hyphomicrobiaceae bacterium]